MTDQKKAKYIIIGAGLSGLTSAYFLSKQNEYDILVLESRERIGGRISTINNIDLGATWFQSYHTHVIDLLNLLDIDKFNQFDKGKSIFIHNSTSPPHYFESSQNQPSHRIVGGSSTIINRLAEVNQEKIKTSTTVVAIEETKEGVTVSTDKGNYYAEKVIITVPPKVASQISLIPKP